MYGLNLIHAGFLAAGLAVAIPIVIHLLFRQRSRTVPIGSLRFLRQVVKEHRRRRRLRQWLLLALRMLAVSLLALLFARPYINDAARKGGQQEIVLLVDRSASMQASSGRKTAFAQALANVQEELNRIDENAIIHLALCDSTAVEEIPVDRLAQAQPSEAATDFGLALGWAGDVFAASERSQRQVVLYTDLQRSGVPRGRPAALPDGVELLVKDVSEGSVQNVSIESSEAVHTELRPESNVLVRAVVRNHGLDMLRQTPVVGELSGPAGVMTAKTEVDLPPQSRTIVELPFAITDDAVYRGEVRVDSSDALPLDNRRFLAFEARHPERVLLVDGQEGRSVFSNETYFLETALRLTTEETESRLRSFEPDRMVWEAGEGFPRLDGFRAIVLANVRRLSDVDARRLKEYVEKSGKLLVFTGDQTTRETLAPLAKQDLLPGEVAAAPVNGPLRVDAWDEEHPALTCFRDPQQGDLRRIVLDQALPVESLADGARPLLLSQGRVLAAERRVGAGACLYIGMTADRDWTDLPRTRLYVPLMRQLMAYLTDQLGNRGLVVNRLIRTATEHAGLVSTDGNWIVTNLDPKESALERIDVDELQRAFGGEAVQSEDREVEAAWSKILPAGRQRPEEIWTTILWLLFFVLSAELLLAARVHA
ncbi:MAG TPA: BatA domain-containing protein [Pirellulales bacterium]|nr:BatA domain-containing protein [Pirellulales bacterium]